MGQIILSYSTIDNLHKASHTWVCKQLGIQTPTTPAMQSGKDAHKIIQDHISGVKKHDGLILDLDFPKIEHHARKIHDDKYTFHGFVDGCNFASKSFLEIKTGGKKTWSQGDFDKSMQPAYYSWVLGFRKAFFITCLFDLSNMKTYYREFTDEDWKRAEEWAKEGIEIIEKGDYKGGLDENGKCLGCSYGSACHFA